MTHYKSCLLIFSIFFWSGIKEEPKQQNNNRRNLHYHQKNPWNKLFKFFHCFAHFTSLTNCAMAFLLFKPVLACTFLNSSLCTLAFSYPCCALCNNSLAAFITTTLLLAIAVQGHLWTQAKDAFLWTHSSTHNLTIALWFGCFIVVLLTTRLTVYTKESCVS